MKYQEYIGEIKEELGERLELVMLRLSSMAKEEVLAEPYAHYFKTISEYTLELYRIWGDVREGTFVNYSEAELKLLNQKSHENQDYLYQRGQFFHKKYKPSELPCKGLGNILFR